MKLLAALMTLTFAMNSFASWRSETKQVLKEYKYACQTTEVAVDSITANEYITGHITGLPTEAYEKFKVVFYVKTNRWYVHPYAYYEGQDEGYSYSNLNANGQFKVRTIKRAVPSKELAVVLVPKAYKIRSQKWTLNPILGFLGGVLKYDCSNVLVPGNGDF
ncbi:MAG: hypothetical protein H0V66_15330 [Bdellovibrionales bacterium]|nr:hypothetical protein [Bdellovibrionales bacterium]